MKIGDRIKAARIRSGKGRQEAANSIGINYSTYANYENNIREPNVEVVAKIASVLNVSADYLCGTGLYAKSDLVMNHLDAFESAVRDLGGVWYGEKREHVCPDGAIREHSLKDLIELSTDEEKLHIFANIFYDATLENNELRVFVRF